jgi:hypothetical protein
MAKIICSAVGNSKIGATGGWDIFPALDSSYIQLSGQNSWSTVSISVPAMQEGDVIIGYHLIGRIETAGDNASLEFALCKIRPFQNYMSGSGVQGIGGQAISVSAESNLLLSNLNAGRSGFSEVVDGTETFAVMITGSSSGAAIIQITGVAIVFNRP